MSIKRQAKRLARQGKRLTIRVTGGRSPQAYHVPGDLTPLGEAPIPPVPCGRNEKCYCGSGKKHKHCCLRRD